MAAVALVALIPITPGAVGVSEVAYIGFLSAVAGEGLTDEITAAIVIFRAAQWLAPIPIGWILLVIMRGSHWREIAQVSDSAASPTVEARVANGHDLSTRPSVLVVPAIDKMPMPHPRRGPWVHGRGSGSSP